MSRPYAGALFHVWVCDLETHWHWTGRGNAFNRRIRRSWITLGRWRGACYGRLRNTCVIATGQACSDTTTTALFNTAYAYDKVGNVTAITDVIHADRVNAGYDALDRLVTFRQDASLTTTLPTISETYTYNAIGNLTGRYGVSATGLITYPAVGSARPHAATGAANGNSYVYDANGNMTVRVEMSGTQTFTYTRAWTVDNRLASVVKSDVTGTILATTTIAYDGDGVRVKKVDPSGTTLYLGAVEVLITGTTQLTTSYYAFGGSMVAMRTAVTATLTYLHSDHLGSTSLTTNAAGQKVSEQRYKPYGEVRWASGAGLPTDPSTDRITGPLRAGFTFTLRLRSGQASGRPVTAPFYVRPGVFAGAMRLLERQRDQRSVWARLSESDTCSGWAHEPYASPQTACFRRRSKR